MLTLSTTQITHWVGGVIWPFVRISAMLLSAPIFGSIAVPVSVRLAMALVLAWTLQPFLPSVPAIDPLSIEGGLVTASQILIGVAMGFILQMAFSAIMLAGEAISLSMGLGFATLVDAQNGVQVPVVGQLYLILVTLLFLSFNGHLLFLDMLVRSFHMLPVGPLMLTKKSLWEIVRWGSTMYTVAMLVALPAVASLMLVNIAFGVITKAAPQLNIFAVGFPMIIMLGFMLMMLSIPDLAPRFSSLLNQAFTLMHSILSGS